MSIDKIVETLNSILIEVIDKYLPRQDIQLENILTRSEQITLDEVSNILKTLTDGTIYDTNNPTYRLPMPEVIVNPIDSNIGVVNSELPPTINGSLITKTKWAWENSQIQYKNSNGVNTVKINIDEYLDVTHFDGSFNNVI